jgi:glycosyltransferase involved in cell wall biosynthesis
MRIAFVVPYVPNLIRARPYNIIQTLLHRGHAITIFTQYATDNEQQDAVYLTRMGAQVKAWSVPRWRPAWNALTALPTGASLQAAYSRLPQLTEELVSMAAARQFDVVHVEHLRGAHYALQLKARGCPVPVIWDSVDCISYLFAQAAASSSNPRWRMLTRLDLERTRRFEALVRDRVDRTLITSVIDRQALLALPTSPDAAPTTPIVEVVPNGVDLAYFAPGTETRDATALVFSGKMSYHANITAALHLLSSIMPRVWHRLPDAHLWIVGKDPDPALYKAAAQYPKQVTITGSVPDIRSYIQQATLSVAPIVYGAGNQNKILEAMACATPVIAARRATAAFSAVEGEQILVFDDAVEAAEQIVHLLSHPELARRIGRAGREYVEEHHQWDAIAARIEGIYGESIRR